MDAELAAARRLLEDFPTFCATFVKIKNKEGEVVPFILNAHQNRLWKSIKRAKKLDRPIRIVILKARQLGFSTFMQAYLFWLAVTKPGSGSLVVAHKKTRLLSCSARSNLCTATSPKNSTQN
jgi:hypothetical protein